MPVVVIFQDGLRAGLGGLWQAAVLGFAGLAMGADGLRCDPRLPDTWQSLRFSVQWRGRTVRVEIARGPLLTFTATLVRGRPLALELPGLRHRLCAGQPWRCVWERRDRAWKEAPP